MRRPSNDPPLDYTGLTPDEEAVVRIEVTALTAKIGAQRARAVGRAHIDEMLRRRATDAP